MRILILGGTIFLGRALVEAALQRGHTLTLFNRGKSDPELFPKVEKLHGDRDGNLTALQDRQWDAVIDTCGYIPRIVQQSAALLKDNVAHYTFISSLSVYADASQPDVDENGTLATLEDPTVEEITGETYGPLKMLCEQAVEREFPDRTLLIRPGLIVGDYDRSDRFTYWPHRIAQGGEVLLPGRPEREVQFIDVRDLAEWTLTMVENARTGSYNADGPATPIAMQKVIETCLQVSQSDAQLTWVPDDFLLEHKVGPWMEMPLWIPESDPESAGFFAFYCSKAIREGLTFRPLADTVRETLRWAQSRPKDHPWRAGMTRERETELLNLWRTQCKAG
jgi:2'-hydroxyisoflavone reductase